MICFPNAKINLGLYVTGKRPDNYHSIESVFYPIPLFDILEVVHTSGNFEMTCSGLKISGNSSDNLCVKAFDLIKKKYHIPNVKAHLHKVIPMGAGLGGGSADGAFMINLLNDFFELNSTVSERQELASQLGSDCPFFIENKPSFVTGRGECLQPISVSLNGYCVIVYPNLHMGTKEAYAGITPRAAKLDLRELVKSENSNRWKHTLRNQFEDSVFSVFPVVEQIKQKLYTRGADYCSMTGSGTAVYAFFKEKPILNDLFNDYFVWKGLSSDPIRTI